MIRFLFVFLAFLLFAGPGSAHGMGANGHANGAVVQLPDDLSPPALPSGHHHNDPTNLHCTVSVSCAPVFTLGAPDFLTVPGRVSRSWSMAREDVLRASTLQRDPPVPRA